MTAQTFQLTNTRVVQETRSRCVKYLYRSKRLSSVRWSAVLLCDCSMTSLPVDIEDYRTLGGGMKYKQEMTLNLHSGIETITLKPLVLTPNPKTTSNEFKRFTRGLSGVLFIFIGHKTDQTSGVLLLLQVISSNLAWVKQPKVLFTVLISFQINSWIKGVVVVEGMCQPHCLLPLLSKLLCSYKSAGRSFQCKQAGAAHNTM